KFGIGNIIISLKYDEQKWSQIINNCLSYVTAIA
ncbi:MAG: hypothetical protein K0R34_4346, partial [Herbinix sp.]|nr:hypothetical protein [Herbinix sp.]